MILVIQGWLPHYRLEVFNALCGVDDVTVAHSGKPARRPGDRFEEIILPADTAGPFRLQRGLSGLIETIRPDAIIAMFDIRWLNSVRAMYRYDRQIPWVWWGLGEGRHKLATRIKTVLARRPNPVVFYSNRSRDAFRDLLPDPERLIVARNTVFVPNRVPCYESPSKTCFINVGSLDARKRNEVVLHALKRIRDSGTAIPNFVLIGSGPERGRLESLAAQLQLNDSVEFLGFVDNPETLAAHYRKAIASVSYDAAGLSVLQSMAYGVPFVTKRDAFSNGETENIIDGETGILFDDGPEGLERALRELIADPDRARRLGAAAYDHFTRTATIENMVASFERAIAFARDRHASRLR